MNENIPAWAQTVINAHTAVTDKVSHGGRLKSDRYFVWTEGADNDACADNGHDCHVMRGTTDLFTKQEFDPWKEDIEASFDACGIAWQRIDVLYEDDTAFWHYVWDWEVLIE